MEQIGPVVSEKKIFKDFPMETDNYKPWGRAILGPGVII